MRILMVTQFYAPIVGGQERAVENLGVALARRGHDVAVATLRLPGLPAFELADDVRIHRVQGTFARVGRFFSDPQRPHVPPVPDPEAARNLGAVIDDERPDVIHAHDWFVHSLLGQLRHRDTPLLFTVHDHSLTCANKRLMQGDEPCSGPQLSKCLRCARVQYGALKGIPTAVALRSRAGAVRRRVDRFLPVSESVAARNGLDDATLSVDVVPNFVPDHVFAAADRNGVTIDDELPADDFLLFVGDATRDKGIDVLLDAHRRLPDRPPLVVIGRALSPALHDAPDDVHVLGPRPHEAVLAADRRAAIVVVPSLCAETFGMVALEAMAMGTPVVAADSGGLREVVTDGESGLLTPPGDAAALATALQRLLDDRELRAQMGGAARRRAEHFREEAVVGRLETIYRAANRSEDAGASKISGY